MREGIGAILLRIGRTGLIAGGFGLALYGGLTALAGRPGAQWLLTITLALPLGLLASWQVIEAWRSGVFPLWLTNVARRDEGPAGFYGAVAWTGLCALLLHGLWLWSAWRLVAG